ncbi:MAG: DUF2142 domain-containing protein [Bacilli bacterium]
MEKNKKNNIIKCIIIILCYFFISAFIFQTEILDISKTPMESTIIGSKETNTGEILSDDRLTQSFNVDENLKGLSIEFGTYDRKNEGIVLIQVQDENGNILKNEMINVPTIKNGEKTKIFFNEEIQIDPQKMYSVVISCPRNGEVNNAITVFSSKEDVYSYGSANLNGVPLEGDLAISLWQGEKTFISIYYWLLILFIAIFLLTIFYFLFLKKTNIQKIFVFSALFLGIMYMFVITPYGGFDELAHFDTAYRYSNFIMGQGLETDSGGLLKRESDDLTGLSLGPPTVETYNRVYYNFLKNDSKSNLVDVPGRFVKEVPYVYFPAMLGITFSRLFHLGQISSLYLVRLFNLICFVIMNYYAIKKVPIGKMVFFCAGLTPFVLFQTSGFSYDQVMISLSFLYTSYCLYAAFGKEKLTKKDIMILCVVGVLLAPCKIVYALVVFLFFIIPKSRISEHYNYRKLIFFFVLSAILMYIFVNFPSIWRSITMENNMSVETLKTTYSFAYIFKEPLLFLKMIFNTLYSRGSYFVTELVGGLYMTTLPVYLTVPYIITLAIASLKYQKEKLYLFRKHKIIMLFIIFGIIFGLFCVGLTWTGTGNSIIEGVQGRYLLPLLPLIVLLGRNSSIVKIKNIDTKLVISTNVLNILSILYIFLFAIKI